ncbi:MAG: type II toxin-antitoxin system VapC family toxin [Rhodocyclaceae bacterium]|nr:type II toxin-antitoxin system VapC family toxin [Rhodocyclaceae bacterium]
MTPQILDTSALLAFLWEEPGEGRVAELLANGRCYLGTTNLAELVSKIIERGLPANEVPSIVNSLNVEIVPLTQAQAELSGILRHSTRHLGLSLGDRACLALTQSLGGVAITADRPWLALDIGIHIECIRPDSH